MLSRWKISHLCEIGWTQFIVFDVERLVVIELNTENIVGTDEENTMVCFE